MLGRWVVPPPFLFTMYERLASAIFNNIQSGLVGLHQTANISIEQIQDDIVDERLTLIKEYTLKGILTSKDLTVSLNCIPVDCKSLSRCKCYTIGDDNIQHFELPLLIFDYNIDPIKYIGSVDMNNAYTVYYDYNTAKQHKYRRRGQDKPYVIIDITPNENNMHDVFVFNAPFLKVISAIFIPKNPKQLENFECCPSEETFDNFNFLNSEIKNRITSKYITWYRQLRMPIIPNNQTPV